jgi:hypothetical protein
MQCKYSFHIIKKIKNYLNNIDLGESNQAFISSAEKSLHL